MSVAHNRDARSVISWRMLPIDPVESDAPCARPSRTLLLTWYTIWCSSSRSRNKQQDFPELASQESLLGGGSCGRPGRDTTLQELTFARYATKGKVPNRLTFNATNRRRRQWEDRAHGQGDQNSPQFLP